ncbi:MAG: EamA family transporter [Acetobacteraceae bacterium]|nr:EamA family transporter [Acetobacteraceae bacterium]
MPIRLAASAAFVAVLWAGNYVATRAALDAHITPLLLVAARFALASSLVLVTPRPSGIGWCGLAAIGIGLGVGQFGLATLAIDAGLLPGVTALVLQTQSLFTIGLAAAFLDERPSLRTLGGSTLALIGVASLLGLDTPSRPGLALAACAAVAAAGFNIMIKRLAPSADPLRMAVWLSPFPVLPLLALSCVVEGSPVLSIASIDLRIVVPALVYGGLISSVAGTALWTRLLQQLPASRLAPFTLLVPIFGVALSAAIDGKLPEPGTALTFCAVLGGLALAQGRCADRPHFHSLSRARVAL